ncbi:NADH-quinone oxidoreductase subunit J [Candidatus Entotheonellaceae bacterium PAL068K]
MYFFFFLFAIGGVASALMVITRKNVMHAALFLFLTFFCVGATYVLLQAELLAAAQVLVYAGAIMVLFLFAILLVNIPRALRLRQWTGQSILAVPLASIMGLGLIYTLSQAFGKFELADSAAQQPLGTPKAIGRTLFTDYVLPFEIASIILLAAMIGAIYLAREPAPGGERMPEPDAVPSLLETSEADR